MTGDLMPRAAGPVDRLGDVLGLFDELAGLAEVGEKLTRRLEAVSGLRAGELQALLAVADGAAHPRAVARRTGQVDGAGAATVQALVQRGLLARHRHPASPADGNDAALVHLTEAGRVVLAQAQALQIRALASVVDDLGDAQARSLRSSVQALGTALAADDRGHGAPPALSAVPPLGA